MKKEFVQCEFCKVEIPSGTCQLASYSTVIDGKEYVFCCKSCAERYQQKKKKAAAK
jgi:YHS domain-containing protein